ncbi:MAG: GAF domain-containing protein [Cytophagales bacterium]|nr:MAG: GAF domain-containing protein [Cytophagales bacterium]
MYKNFRVYSKTIRGRTTLLIASFLVTLICFNSYMYYEIKQFERKYNDFEKHWHNLQLNLFISYATFVGTQYQVLDIVYNAKTDTTEFHAQKLDGYSSYSHNFSLHFDSLHTDFNYKPITDEMVLKINDVLDSKYDIVNRIKFLKDKNQIDLIRKDSLINKVYVAKIAIAGDYFWQKFFPSIISTIDNGIRASDKEIRWINKRLIIIVVVFSVLLSLFYAYLWYKFIHSLTRSLAKPIKILEKLSEGDLAFKNEITENELSTIIDASRKLSESLTKASDFSLEIGKGNFNHEFQPIGEKDVLGNSLILMRNELKIYAEKEAQTNWSNVGLTKFALLLRRNDLTLDKISNLILAELIKYIHANQGGVFIWDETKKVLILHACYAYDKKKHLEKEVLEGEGLIGQCFFENDKIFLTDIPKDYVHITSGLGHSTPRVLLLVPIKTNEQSFGVIEIASFNTLKDFEIEFVEKVADALAAVITNITKNQLNEKLLNESTVFSENLRSQEEEMRQNLEELNATQEEMQRKEQIFIDEINMLKSKLEIAESKLASQLV